MASLSIAPLFALIEGCRETELSGEAALATFSSHEIIAPQELP
jgi:hypothetical protein